MVKGYLTNLLPEEYRDWELTKEEDFVYLKKDGKVWGTWSVKGATINGVVEHIKELENLMVCRSCI